MKLLMIVDMEGCFGVSDLQDYETSRRRMVEETKYIIDYFCKKEINEITVVDSHDSGHNLDELKKVYPDIIFVPHIWNLQNVEQFDKAILTGAHAKSGSEGLFSHTYRPEIKAIRANGCEIGEVSLLVDFLTNYNVEVCCVSGESYTKNEVERLGISFFPTNGKKFKSAHTEKLYEKLAAHLYACIISKNKCSHIYEASKLQIEFKNKEIVAFLPDDLFDKTLEGISFENVIVFYAKILVLSKFLNLYYDIKFDALSRLKKIIRSRWKKEEYDAICDRQCKCILEKKFEEIHRNDIMYLVNHFKKYYDSTCWDMIMY